MKAGIIPWEKPPFFKIVLKPENGSERSLLARWSYEGFNLATKQFDLGDDGVPNEVILEPVKVWSEDR